MKANYSIPKLIKSKKGWFIRFRYNGKPFEIYTFTRLKLNKNTSDDEKEYEFKILETAYFKKLKEGWFPGKPEEIIPTTIQYTITQAIDFALSKKKSKNSKKKVIIVNGK